MRDDARRREALEEIRQNIAEVGFHAYIVAGATIPRYAYTIGLLQSIGAEIIFAGLHEFVLDELFELITMLVAELKLLPKLDSLASLGAQRIDLGEWGVFSLSEVHPIWVSSMMLGALDFYQSKDIPAFQVLPDEAHWTIDVPDLSKPWSASKAPAWQWLHEKWQFPIPETSVGITNLRALHGEPITEVMRWEEDEWELFAGVGTDVPKNEIRSVPLGVLLTSDSSLSPILNLTLGSGFWREDGASEWNPWASRQGGAP